MIISTRTKDLTILIVVYFLAYGLMLLNRNIYWDDWVWYELRPDLLKNSMSQLGYPGLAYLHIWLQKGGVLLYRYFTFACYLVAAIALYLALSANDKIPRLYRLFITLVFAIFPVNSARILICTVHYSLSYAAFFIAFYAFSKYVATRKWKFGILAWVLFAGSSYLVNSLLVFYALIPIYLLFMNYWNQERTQSISELIRSYGVFLILPILTFGAKQLWGRPYGIYLGYNSISLPDASLFPRQIAYVIHECLFKPVKFAFKAGASTPWLWAISALVLVGLIVVMRRMTSKIASRESSFERYPIFNLLLGLIMLLLAIIPYMVVGKTPEALGWESRHQLLVPLGCAWLVVALAVQLQKITKIPAILVLSIFCSVFVAGNIRDNLIYVRDGFKQESIMMNAASDKQLEQGGGTTYFMRDSTKDLNWNSRCVSFYEYAGMFSQAFREETRLPIGDCELSNFDSMKPAFTASYHLNAVAIALPTKEIRIGYGTYKLDFVGTIKLICQYYINPMQYRTNIRQIVQLHVVPFVPPTQ
ncbi:hypothetical protein [Herbaspirillum seropedicae]|uniref:hypothetical protein n=1 Tax=Herbaspirillum seropedicae TaxID=964 RepID=UPI003D9951BF